MPIRSIFDPKDLAQNLKTWLGGSQRLIRILTRYQYVMSKNKPSENIQKVFRVLLRVVREGWAQLMFWSIYWWYLMFMLEKFDM